jgi:hypothetical protein
VTRLVVRRPRLGYAVASALDRVDRRLGQSNRARWRAEVVGQCFRARVPDPYPAVFRGALPPLPEPPMVLVSFHIGAYRSVTRLLERLSAPVFLLADVVGRRPLPRVTMFAIGDSPSRRLMGMKLALDELRAGRFVFLFIEGGKSSAVPVTISGRSHGLARGPFVLARLAGVPVLPLVARWRGGKVQYTFGRPIEVADEATMAAAVAGWFDEYMSAHPDVLELPLGAPFRRAS